MYYKFEFCHTNLYLYIIDLKWNKRQMKELKIYQSNYTHTQSNAK